MPFGVPRKGSEPGFSMQSGYWVWLPIGLKSLGWKQEQTGILKLPQVIFSVRVEAEFIFGVRLAFYFVKNITYWRTQGQVKLLVYSGEVWDRIAQLLCMTMYQNITNCNSGKYDMSEGSWGLGFQDTGDGGRWAGPQHGRGQRSASVSSGLLVGGHGWWTPGAMISDVHF